MSGAFRWREYTAALALVLAAGATVHGRRVSHGFHRHRWEDWRFLRHTREHVHTLADCFTQPGAWPGLYRPLSTNLYYFAGTRAFGFRIEPFHMTLALLFVTNALLLFAIARHLLGPPWAFLPPVLAASRLTHFQLLVETTEMQALLSTFFALACILFFLRTDEPHRRRDEALAAGALVLALLSKESVAVVPAICTAYAWLRDGRRALRRTLPLWAVTVVWAVVFQAARRWVDAGEPTGFAYELSWRVVTHYVTYALSFVNLLAWPVDSAEMATGVVAAAGRVWLEAAVILALGLGLFAPRVGAALRRSGEPASAGDSAVRTIAFGCWWFVLATTPFVFFMDRLFMRYAYFGHAGLAIAVAGCVKVLLQPVLTSLGAAAPRAGQTPAIARSP